MIHLDTADLIVIASKVIGGTPDDVMQVLDADEAESALARAQKGRGRTGPAGTAHQTAASLLHELMTARLLPRGNGRLAVLATLQFLSLNGLEVDLDPLDKALDMLTAVASGAADRDRTAAWFEKRMRTSARLGPRPFTVFERRQESPSLLARRDTALDELRRRLHLLLIEALGPLLSGGDMGEPELRRRAEGEVRSALAAEGVPLGAAGRDELIRELVDDIAGYGPIDPYLKDPDVTEIMVNGPDNIYVERFGKIGRADASFMDVSHLRRVIDKIVGQVGRRVDESTPMVDARLPDGSRVNAVVHPLAVGGPFLTIRKFSAGALNVDDLIELGTFDETVAWFLDACVRGRLNIVVSGGTGTGKTTLLNAISSFIPRDERIVTIEDAKELRLHQGHVLSLEARQPNIEGKGRVTIRDLVRNALRMRPDRIVVGECRAGEAIDMLQAMNTGHDGSLTTIHSNSPRDTLSRIETMTAMAGLGLPLAAIREQMASALHLIVHLSRLRDGSRRVTQVAEVRDLAGDVIVLEDLYLFDWGAGVDERGRHRGRLKPTGIYPQFGQRLADLGIELPPELFL